MIYLGADHQGFYLKNKIADYLTKQGYQIADCSNQKFDPNDDFPEFAHRAAVKLVDEVDDIDQAILICGGGQGMAMAANRTKGVRAIVATSVSDARYGRNDNDANCICLPARVLDKDYNEPLWKDIIDTFLKTPFAGAERYIRRNKELDEL